MSPRHAAFAFLFLGGIASSCGGGEITALATTATAGTGGTSGVGGGATDGNAGSVGDGGRAGQTGSGAAAGVAGKGGLSGAAGISGSAGLSGGAGLSGSGGVAGSGGAGGGGGVAGGLPASTCGDGMKTGIEACDGADLGGATCETVIATGSTGNLGCTPDCMQFDSSGCSGTICSMAGAQAGAPWPMAGRCAARTGRSPFVGPQTPTLRWAFVTDDHPVSAPVIAADGTVYLSTLGALNALTPQGQKLWMKAMLGGPLASPAIGADGTLYVSAAGSILIISPDGTVKTAVSPSSGDATMPALGGDGTIYVGFGVALGEGGGLYSLDPEGHTNWAFSTQQAPLNPIPSAMSAPALGADGTTYAGSNDGSLYALNKLGLVSWASSITGGAQAPIVAPDGTIYVYSIGGTGGSVHSIGVGGIQKWQISLSGNDAIAGGSIMGAVAADGTVYVGGSDNKLHAIDESGKPEWVFATGGQVSGAAVVGADGTVYFGSSDGKVYALGHDGNTKWSFQTGGIATAPSIGANRTLYVGSLDGNLYAIGP